MRVVAMLVAALAACGGEPMLANAPRPDPGAVAGVAAAAAAAATLADPNAADRKPEKKDQTPKNPVEVKENVPADVFDRLDKQPAGSGSEVERPHASPKRKGPPPKIPSPKDAVEHSQSDR
jgi:hypothetical protein